MQPERPDDEASAPAGFPAAVERIGRPRTGSTWLIAVLLAIVVGVAWAVPFVFLLYAWFLTIPLWLLTTVSVAAGCFGLRLRYPRALAYGFGLLASIPIAVATAIGVFLASAR